MALIGGQQLEASERRYRLLFEQNPQAMWVYEVDTLRFIEVNDAAVQQYGYSRDEFLTMRLMDIRPAEDAAQLFADVADSRDGWSRSGIWRHRLKSGRTIDVDIVSHSVTLNKRSARVVVAQDVTDRRRAEAALTSSEARKTAMLESALDGIISIDAAGRVIDFNPAAERTFGYRHAEAIGKRLADLIIPPDLRGAHREGLKRYHATGTPVLLGRRIETRAVRADGSEFPVELAIAAVKNPDGDIFTGYLRDISDRKQAEAILAERVRITALTADVGLALNRPDPLPRCLQACAEALARHLDEAFARIWTVNATNDVLELQASAGLCAHIDGSHNRIPIGQSEIGRIARNRCPLLTNDLAADPEIHDRAWATKENMVAFAGHPLIVENRLVGVMALFTRKPLSEVVMAALGSVADHIALGITRHQVEGERELLAAIVEDSEDAIISKTLDGVILSWNAGAEKLYGYSAEEAVGQSMSLIAPTDRAQELPELLARLRAGEHLKHYETIRRRKDGSQVPVSLTLSPIRDRTGQITAASAIARDMTERQRAERSLHDAEERMRLALEASGVGVWEADLKTGISFWSATCEAMHGLAPGTFGKTLDAFIDRVHLDDREQVRRTLAQAVDEHTKAELEYRTEWPDGAVHRIATTAHFFCNEAGIPVRGAGVSVDVTDRRSLEDQLRQAQKMEAVGQLAGGIAHDFNNMLTAILGNSELVLETLPREDPRREDVEEIMNAARRATALTHQLLAFSRKQILAPRVLQLGDVVSGVKPMLRRLLGETIDLRTMVSDSGHVKADAGQMEQVLLNLAVNARDAMPDGGRLTIETADVSLDDTYARQHATVDPGPHVMVAVSDTGHGMDAGTQKRVFEPFFTTKPSGQGTGLGLATVYGIVKQSGGHIVLYSEVGRGTTFKIYLPRTDEVEDASQAKLVDARSLRGSETILLVEDENAVREFVHKILNLYGYVVHAMADPGQALAFARAHRASIHVLLTDVVLPMMSGLAMAAEVQRDHPEAQVLYMSGYTDDAIVHHGVLDPGMWFLQKPFTGEALVNKLRDLLSPVAG